MLAAADETAVAELLVARTARRNFAHSGNLDTGYSEKHPEESYRANVQLPTLGGQGRADSGCKACVFQLGSGLRGLTDIGPFAEDTPLSPANVYGRHKLEAEQRVLDARPDAVLLRATWMYDLPGYGLPIRGNFLLNLYSAALHGGTLRFLLP